MQQRSIKSAFTHVFRSFRISLLSAVAKSMFVHRPFPMLSYPLQRRLPSLESCQGQQPQSDYRRNNAFEDLFNSKFEIHIPSYSRTFSRRIISSPK